ncbi:diphthine--ammonia ligase [Lentibacillus sediminis]|uniref:Dph6-related ATP pyrophosphatase n=1 Tax=Lentibacillus sediminis TaxID=1940529 RepID=UPI0013040D54|nr:diphthine--ammonia ligase [Lentibacillus sediminis]
MVENIIVSWSGGKDSALAVYELLQNDSFEVKGLLSTTSDASGRLPMHEVKRELIQAQADSMGIPLYEVKLPANVDNDTYERTLHQQFDVFKNQGIHSIAYADLFLEDIKNYRDQLLASTGMQGIYPLWKRDIAAVAKEFIEKGFKAVVTTVDSERLNPSCLGKVFDHQFIECLPADVDPCGENGEFHTLVFDGPIFQKQVDVKPGEVFETMSGRFLHVELGWV